MSIPVLSVSKDIVTISIDGEISAIIKNSDDINSTLRAMVFKDKDNVFWRWQADGPKSPLDRQVFSVFTPPDM